MFMKNAILKAVLVQLLYFSEFSTALKSQSTKKSEIKLVSLKSLNRSISSENIKINIIDSLGSERFAEFKGNVREYYIWKAPTASVGKPWPIPLVMRQKEKIINLVDNPAFVVQSQKCNLITSSIIRYKERIFQSKRVTHTPLENIPGQMAKCSFDKEIHCDIRVIKIYVKSCSKNDWPHAEMNETYSLTVKNTEIKIVAEEVWGFLRALETLSQLIYCIFTNQKQWLAINEVEIIDSPKYSYRGLLLDTSRHFIPFDDILIILTAMEMNKLNVFHWHITDDQSFAFESKLHPELHEKGAYEKSMVYNHTAIRFIVQQARERGIRVIPEIDAPGHTASWSKSHPELMSKCIENNGHVSTYGPLNPILQETFALLSDLYTELVSLFPDNFIHIGMDEIGFGCWSTDPTIKKFMEKNKIINFDHLTALFMNELQSIIHNKFPKKIIMVWQEAFERKSMLSKGTIIQIWKNTYQNLQMFQNCGFSLIYSTDFYLDRTDYGPSWVKFYEKDFGSRLNDAFIGGEACMWNEYKSKESVHQAIWPATCAIAEKLWYGTAGSVLAVASRLEEHRCRMLRNGIKVGVASGPSECLYMNEYSKSHINLGNFNTEGQSIHVYDLLTYYFLFLIGLLFGFKMQLLKQKLRRYVLYVLFLPSVMLLMHFWMLTNIFGEK